MDPAAFLCSVVSQADRSGDACNQIEDALPQAEGRVAGSGRSFRAATFGGAGGPARSRGRTASTPRWVGSWRCRDERLKALLLVLVGSLLLTGCEFDVYKLPLPGGTDTGTTR